MWCKRAILLTALLSGCSGRPASTYTTEPEPGDVLSRTPSLQGLLGVAGKVSIAELVYQLRKKEVLTTFPPSGLISGIPVEFVNADPETFRIVDGIRSVEEACGWVFEIVTGEFYVARATHSIDDPDAFGRPGVEDRAPLEARPMIQVAFRFRRVSASLTPDAIGASADGTVFTASLPDGIRESWSKVSEREYFEGVQDANSPNQSVVNTQRRTVESGIEVEALAARLPGGLFRIDGRIMVSSFVGRTGANRSVIDFPLQLDGARGQWCRVVVIKGADLGAGVAFRQFDIDPSGSGEAVELSVRVD